MSLQRFRASRSIPPLARHEFSRMSLQRFRASRSIPPLARHPLTAVGGQPLQTHPAELPQTVIPASVVSSRWLQGGIGSPEDFRRCGRLETAQSHNMLPQLRD